MNSPATDIANYLANSGVGTLNGTTSWRVGIASEPEDPDDTVTVYDYPGAEPDTDQLDILRSNFQVRVRSANYQSAYDKQVAIRDLLIHTPISAESSIFSLVVMQSDIAPIGRDDRERWLLVANYRCRRSETGE